MVSLVTNGVRVSVETFYQPDISKPADNEFLFAYRITIDNTGKNTVRLLRRKWIITDGFGQEKIIEGEGVVGEKPIIEPGETHQYVSGCHLKTEIGKMSGTYSFERHLDNLEMEIAIPEFKLVAPFKLN